MIRRSALALAVALLLGAAAAQGFGASGQIAWRVDNCANLDLAPFSVRPTFLCSATVFVELFPPDLGLLVSTRPESGPFYENFLVYGYRPNLKWDFLGTVVSQAGIATGLREGAWFIQIRTSTVGLFQWGFDDPLSR